LTLIRQARTQILIEGQYYWSKRINRALIRRIYQRSGTPFEIILILTDLTRLRALTRQMAGHGYFLLSALQSACENTGATLKVIHPLIRHPHAPSRFRPKPVYVHSKVLLVDDRYLSIGSTNIAARAFRVDSEVNLTWEAETEQEQRELRDFRQTVLEHWGLKENATYPYHDYQEISPRVELSRWLRSHLVSPLIPWAFFFDPDEPWLRTLKRKLFQPLCTYFGQL
jgi:phosphatidylserine/phosphatidylglycerophosphate/cardiolipin synthase-like enzyme